MINNESMVHQVLVCNILFKIQECASPKIPKSVWQDFVETLLLRKELKEKLQNNDVQAIEKEQEQAMEPDPALR